MESQPQNPEFRNNPENLHPYMNTHAINQSAHEIVVLMAYSKTCLKQPLKKETKIGF